MTETFTSNGSLQQQQIEAVFLKILGVMWSCEQDGRILIINELGVINVKQIGRFIIYLLGSLLPYCPYWAPNAYAPQKSGHPDLDTCGCDHAPPDLDVCGCL